VSEKVVCVAAGGRKGLRLADGGVGALLLRADGIDRFPSKLPPDIDPRFGEAPSDRVLRKPGERKGRSDAQLVEIIRCGVADPPDFFHGERFKVPRDHSAGDGCEPVRLAVFGGDLGQHLGEAQAHRNGDAQFP